MKKKIAEPLTASWLKEVRKALECSRFKLIPPKRDLGCKSDHFEKLTDKQWVTYQAYRAIVDSLHNPVSP